MYWIPVWNVLEAVRLRFELVLVNPQVVRALRGNKTDRIDAARIAEYLQYALLRGSFVPPRPIRELRDLTRSRVHLQQDRNRVLNRMARLLETLNIKLSSVASNIAGKAGAGFGRDRQRAYAAGVSGPAGSWNAEGQGHGNGVAGWAHRGTGGTTVDAWHTASWAGLCPGNQESAGKRFSGRTRKGDRYLRRLLVQNAWAVAHRKDCFPTTLFYRVARQRGPKKPAVAVADCILVWPITLSETDRCTRKWVGIISTDCVPSGRPSG